MHSLTHSPPPPPPPPAAMQSYPLVVDTARAGGTVLLFESAQDTARKPPHTLTAMRCGGTCPERFFRGVFMDPPW